MIEKPIVLITGGTGKLGKSLVQGFAEHGWHVLFTSRSQERADAMAADLAEHGQITGVAAELIEQDGLMALNAELNARGLEPSCLINNARDLAHMSLDDHGRPSREGWLGEFFLSVVAAYELGMEIALDPDSRLENILNVSSMYGLVAPTLHLYDDHTKQSPIHYGVCKSALNHLTKEMAVRLADRKVRVNGIAYGGVEGRVNEEFLQRYSAICPQGRMLQDDEVAGPALFLASEAASAITGHILAADGGWSAH